MENVLNRLKWWKRTDPITAERLNVIHEAIFCLASGENIRTDGTTILKGSSAGTGEIYLKSKPKGKNRGGGALLGFTIKWNEETSKALIKRGVLTGLGWNGPLDEWEGVDWLEMEIEKNPDHWFYFEITFTANTYESEEEDTVLVNGGTATSLEFKYGQLPDDLSTRPTLDNTTGSFAIPLGYITSGGLAVNDMYSPVQMYFCAPDLLSYSGTPMPSTVNISYDILGQEEV